MVVEGQLWPILFGDPADRIGLDARLEISDGTRPVIMIAVGRR